jgi:23S rRNA (adenine2503-C2)-methyltransferase
VAETLPDLRQLGITELEAFFGELGQPAYRAQQVFRWLHQRGARSFAEMTDLPKALRESLPEQASCAPMEIAKVERGRDGTRKYAFRSAKGDVVESVFIPDASAEGRNTLCISSQVGCAIDCKFCLTASLGLLRNLGPGEIVEQITRVVEDLQRVPGPNGEVDKIGNIVMMGMGEPLQNYNAVISSLRIMGHQLSHHISPRRITVSTAGLAPRIPRLGEDVPVNLAISLNATTDEVRDRIMPINKKYNIATLLKACEDFPLQNRRRITFEYVLLAGVNDTDDDARRLVRLLRSFRCKVNLIPFNEHEYSIFKRPTADRVARFQSIVGAAGLTVLVRTPRGDDISAACGQLGAEVDAPRHKLVVLQ